MAKYDKDLDRQAVLFDYKNRIIDLLDNSQPLPETDIYDEPVRYFKANEQWCKVIFGWLTILQMEAGWQDAEDTNYPGIQALLQFEEGIDMALAQDIRDGMYQAINDVAKQIISGRTTNINVGEDGTVSDPSAAADVDLPEDDPDTPLIDESLAASMGGAVAVARGLELFFDKLDAYYGAINGAPVSTEAAAQFGIAAYFPTDPGTMDAAITGYYAYRATNNRILFDTSVAFELYLFCNGANEQGFNRWMVDVSGYVFNKQTVVNGLVAGLAEAFFDDYFAIGLQAPSLNYVDALCVKSPTEIINIVTTGTNYTTLTQWKIGHRLKITVANKWTDPAGIQRDFWYYRTAAGVVSQVFASTSITIGTGVTKPSTTQCPYSSAGDYVFTVEAAATSAMVLNVAAGGVLNAPLTGGPLIVTIEDLGLIS